MTPSFAFDLFLSHSSKDKLDVRALAERLRNDGLRVWLDEWIITPGSLIGLEIEKGLEQSRSLVLVMSSNAFQSEWATLERHTALFRDPSNTQRRFIPLRLDDTELPDTLKQFAYVDWRHKSEEQYARLVTACKAAALGAETFIRQEGGLEAKIKGGTAALGIAITPDGQNAVSGSEEGDIQVWEVNQKLSVATLDGHGLTVPGVAIAEDGKVIVSGSHDRRVGIWKLGIKRWANTSMLKGHTAEVIGVAVTPDGLFAASASWDRTVRIWDIVAQKCVQVLEGHTDYVIRVAVTRDGKFAVSGSKDKSVRLWDVKAGTCIKTLHGHTDTVIGIAITPDGKRAVSGSEDKTLRVWDLEALKCVAALEGHTGSVGSVAITNDGRRAISASWDRTIKVWDVESGQCVATLKGHAYPVRGVAATPDGRRAVTVAEDSSIHVWELPEEIKGSPKEGGLTRYTNAKVLLVGESGVGKTGLAIRLTQDRFDASISSDGAWATQMKLPSRSDKGDIEREIWLWDFAGQADYRLIHQLFMDETALAVLVFNPQNEDPFEGLSHWDRDLTKAARRSFKKLVVAGRCDRGGLMISRRSFETFRKDRNFSQFIETSALTGQGCQEVREAIIENIDWTKVPWTASPRIFKLLKEQVVQLRDEGKVLLRTTELKQQLEMRLPDSVFTIDQLRAVIGLLAGPGIVWQLEFGDFVLLQPERINAYAAAVIRAVRSHTDEIGCIAEELVLTGKIDYQDMKRLPAVEEQIILRAMHQTFIEHGLCLRQMTEEGPLLVFPSYFKRERPDLSGHPLPFVSYLFSGALDEIYATLVVRLHHTSAFDHDQLWRFAADFKTQEGRRVGLKMIKKGEGAAEISIYFEQRIPDDTKVTFIRYVDDHIKSKDPSMIRVRHYSCSHCQTPVENSRAVQDRLVRGLEDIVCVNCEKRIKLVDLIEQKFASDTFKERAREIAREANMKMDTENQELVIFAHAMAICSEAGAIFRTIDTPDIGVDAEIRFRDPAFNASDYRIYLQLRSTDYYLLARSQDGVDRFHIKNFRSAEIWPKLGSPVMLVNRASDGVIAWMDASNYIKEEREKTTGAIREIIFSGEPFTALSLQRLRDKVQDTREVKR
jgi:small GTP-binding protein